jgi:flagellar basal-body rod protein FlgC
MDGNRSLETAMKVAASGLRAQSARMRVITENIANQDSLSTAPGVDPYRRRIVSFRQALDAETGTPMITVDKVRNAPGAFGSRYIPGHPGADDKGYVKTPNVNSLIEATDMREAQRSYEANLQAIEAAKSMLMRTVDLLR